MLSLLPLHQIEWHVIRFLEFARDNPQLQFFVTRVGCGLAGYPDDQVSGFFEYALENCILPNGWRPTDAANKHSEEQSV
jgi:hypothetical protein